MRSLSSARLTSWNQRVSERTSTSASSSDEPGHELGELVGRRVVALARALAERDGAPRAARARACPSPRADDLGEHVAQQRLVVGERAPGRLARGRFGLEDLGRHPRQGGDRDRIGVPTGGQRSGGPDRPRVGVREGAQRSVQNPSAPTWRSCATRPSCSRASSSDRSGPPRRPRAWPGGSEPRRARPPPSRAARGGPAPASGWRRSRRRRRRAGSPARRCARRRRAARPRRTGTCSGARPTSWRASRPARVPPGRARARRPCPRAARPRSPARPSSARARRGRSRRRAPRPRAWPARRAARRRRCARAARAAAATSAPGVAAGGHDRAAGRHRGRHARALGGVDRHAVVVRDLAVGRGLQLGREAALEVVVRALAQSDHALGPAHALAVEPLQAPAERLGAVGPRTGRVGELDDLDRGHPVACIA